MIGSSGVRYPPSGLTDLGRGLLIGLVAAMTAPIVLIWLFVLFLHPPWLWIFAVFGTVVVGVNAYRFLWRDAWELTVDDGYLEWRGALLCGRTPVTTLRRVRPSRVEGTGVQVIERSNGRSIVIWARYQMRPHFQLFCRELKERNPELDVRRDWWSSWVRSLRNGPSSLFGRR